MNGLEFKTLLKVALVCIVLIAVSPFVLGLFGFLIKGVMYVGLFIVLAIVLAMIYFKFKIRKIGKEQFNGMEHNGSSDKPKEDYNRGEVDIDYSDSTIIDVKEYKEEK